MLRYDLDKLGWYEFENLCQILLKHKLGLGVEAWGGTKDLGRDAYYQGDLKYPTEEMRNGPFLFQCKFVNGANSAGAKNENLVLNAVKAECKSIKKKLSDANGGMQKSGQWNNPPKTYTFMSNAIIRPLLRKKIEKCIKEVLPDCIFVKQDGKDICGMVDLTTGIVRRFPQLLSLKDLEFLLSDCVNRDILNRSEAAIEEAKEISQIFVPTKAYSKALNTLQKFFYVVLEGPPEAGKTAIGRMIALSYIPEGWDAIECQKPNDFLQKYEPNRKQIFLADDSFGRTEYRPDRVSLWQDDLPAILRKINKHHLLILTSRKHLLEMAKDKLDISGANRDFPSLAEILVDVSSLTKVNKTLMLYKHMKNTILTDAKKISIQKLAETVIEHKGFTPERIRELTQKIRATDITFKLIQDTLRNPTDRMSKTYRELPIAHKWFMISILLDSSELANETTIKDCYDILCPSEYMFNFDKIKTQLSEAFIKTMRLYTPTGQIVDGSIEWIHPSCGDMVAIELSDNPKDRLHFLTHCSLSGLKYAISVGGGSTGSLILPLLKSPTDWKIFKARCNENWGASLLYNICDSVQQLAKDTKYHKEKELLKNILIEVTLNTIKKINANNSSSSDLSSTLKVIKLYPDITQLPTVAYKKTWLDYANSAIEILEDDYSKWHTFAGIDIFISLSNAIKSYDSHGFNDDNEIQLKWQNFIEVLFRRGREESSMSGYDIEPEAAEELHSSYIETKELFEEVSTMVSEEESIECVCISENYDTLIDELCDVIPHEDEYDRNEDIYSSPSNEFSVESIFKDL